MTLFNKLLIAIGVGLLGWLLYLVNDQGNQIKTITKENTRLTIHIKELEVLTEKETRTPDGTVVVERKKVTTTTKDSEGTTDKKIVSDEKTVSKESKDVGRNFSVGIRYSSRDLHDRNDISAYLMAPAIEGGYKIGGPLWVTGSYNPWSKELTVGARIEF